MRLSPDEVAAIKTAAAEAFGETAVVRLFGSRVHDDLRGGDIDLLVEVNDIDDELRQRTTFESRFWAMTEPRKVDVLVAVRGRPPGPFERIAYRDGIVL
ncbi:nucleotidyltransferase domain-containing protein [Sphingomonas sp. A2-49]|uniref:nucleotidyltransferase domain-containing protein n=1 Tax=Sphingomonas sp. A2-49 TaxID=1391375 RepID=UPI0021D291E6|nr:nucleotidyltransferase domain-containing protein [Sphingomonas sp. A2-49]MCU6454910.1 nucleotidyltransferase domain-containing protein [Sphingomonas sp. A2-49]